ncbi:alpha/beta fold hydrolase [Ectobacillus sp. sgz5001026]|uniref:alpha/beta fold hydrolase n=1 Tax=Ectobacillus sp. sgz5001026 TaxID=3242473 RepID=UPI0036D2EC41
MSIVERFFTLENEPCVIHLSDRPNGFGILLLGDYNHFVDNRTSLWMQHNGKAKLLNALVRKGYTIFTSNLYGRHWGSNAAVTLAKRLYHVVMKKEILNENIHIIAEGMGALVALQIMHNNPSYIRSAVLINPCLHLPRHIELEREHKFFYKRLLRELTIAYQSEDNMIQAISSKTFQNNPSSIPVQLLVPIHEKNERKMVIRDFEQFHSKTGDVFLLFHFPESKYNMADAISQFYRNNEKL